MKQDFNHPVPAQAGIRGVFFEAFWVALIGSIVALTANAVSPRGLSLVKNYFPGTAGNSVAPPILATPANGVTSTNELPASQSVAGRIEAEGLHALDVNQTAQLFNSPGFRKGSIVFVDARDEEHYREGHVPAAYELDTYHLEKRLAEVLPVCQAAEQIVVYCHGGDCEDSRFAATTLQNAGIPKEKLFVFTGGISEWQAGNLPVETGERNSGEIHTTPP